MIVFHDAFTGDELFTDSNKIQKVARSEVYRVTCTEIVKKESGDFNIGANASQEEAAEELEESVVRGVDIVINQHLEECTQEYTMKNYNLFLRDYFKRIINSIKESDLSDEEKSAQTAAFKEEAVQFTNLVKKNFDDIQFFRFPIDYEDPKDITGFVIPLHRDNSTDCITMWFFRRGLREEKC
ncbi:translationally-controlled tumor protein homolog [Haliotis asinina]|uniref:translationally-controlled tumor protein homolog n=1 Tax=Haliotis asinina TaxID=109174 RepID=UPI003531A344